MADSDAAAVGAISHILKTAFKDVYADTEKRNEAKAAKNSPSRAVKEEKEAEVEKEDEEEGNGDTNEDAAATGTEGGDAAVEEGKEASSEKVVAEAPLYKTPLDDLDILPHLKADLEQRHAQIDDMIESKIAAAAELTKYIKDQKQKAYDEEEEEEEMLKKQGIMIGQHIPPLPTKLDVKASVLGSYGDYSSDLQIANELVEQNKVNTLRRTGNLPISDLAETKKEERNRKTAHQVSLSQTLKGLFLYTGCFLFHDKWCIGQL